MEQQVSVSIWKRTVEKSQTNATNWMMTYSEKEILESIWRRTVKEIKQMQSMRLQINLSRQFWKAFKNTV